MSTTNQKHRINQKVMVDIWNYKTKQIDQHPAMITNIVTALDCEYRVNVLLQDGREIAEAHPECVHLTLTNIH